MNNTKSKNPLVIYRKCKRLRSISKVATLYGLSRSTVYGLLDRAFSLLGERISRNGGFSTSVDKLEISCVCGCGKKVIVDAIPKNVVKFNHILKGHEGYLAKGRKWTQEQKDRVKGKKLSESHRRKISEARKGYKPSKEAIQKWKDSMKKRGFSHLRTKEYRKKMSEIVKNIRRRNPQIAQVQMSNLDHSQVLFRRGYFKSDKSRIHEKMFFRSSLELKALVLFELDPSVVSFTTEPYSIQYVFDGVEKRYVPDIEVFYDDGSSCLIEIKPSFQIDDPINIAKFEVARDFCTRNNMNFKVLTELEINQAIAKRGELRESLRSVIAEYGNSQLSPSKGFPIYGIVDGKVQRLTAYCNENSPKGGIIE